MVDRKSKFLGIGVLREFNRAKRILRAVTSVTEKPARIVAGKVWLDENLREAPIALEAAR